MDSLTENAAQLFRNMLPNGGVSAWVEDWSAAAGFIQKLRDLGEDPLGYCAKHPEEYQSLHAQVRITDVNDVTLRMMRAARKADLIGPLSEILPYSIFTFPRWLAAMASGVTAYRGQNAIRRLDGGVCECLLSALLPADMRQLSHVIVLVMDVSDYYGRSGATVMNAIQHASRLSAMGALTASIAHEVKNPLAAIVANAGACRRWLRQPQPNLKEADAAIAALVQDAGRAQEIVERTLSFASPAAPGKAEFDIVNLVNDVIMLMVGDLRGCDVEIVFRPEGELSRVIADPVQIQQVLVNLILNAAQALTNATGSRLITVRVTEARDTILTEVSDHGIGIRPEQFSRLFEPFYTSKSGGIGMGLAVSKACVEANGGKIWATSKLHEGAQFYFTLPINTAAAGAAISHPEIAPREPDPPMISRTSFASPKPGESSR